MTKVILSTSFGNMTIELFDETPQHRDNFIKLVQKNFYDGLLFHRVIKDFMIQGGDPESKNAPEGKQLGAGDVGYTIPAEFVYPKYFHRKGALAAARQGDQVNPKKASSGCQFYIVQGKKCSEKELEQLERSALQAAKQHRFNEMVEEHMTEIRTLRLNRDREGINTLQEQLISQLEKEFAGKKSIPFTAEQREAYLNEGGTPFLDNEYTVFGQVVEGLEIIDKIAAVKTARADRPKEDIKMEIRIIEA